MQGLSVCFRCDAGPGIGGGHVMRCLALAAALKSRGARVTFLVRAGTLEGAPALEQSGFEWRLVEGNVEGEPQTLADLMDGGCDLLVVDHYGRSADFEIACRGWANRIAVIADLPGTRPHHCDILLDYTPGHGAADWRADVAPQTALLCGPSYALLRSGIRALRKPAPETAQPDSVQRILINFGLSDSRNATGIAMQAVHAALADAEVDVVMGASAPHLAAVATLAKDLGMQLWVNPPQFDEILAAADLVVGGGGVSALERACLGKPGIVVEIADNQRKMIAALAEAGVIRACGRVDSLTPATLAGSIRDLAADGATRRDMAAKAASLVDGMGADRAARAMLDLVRIAPRVPT